MCLGILGLEGSCCGEGKCQDAGVRRLQRAAFRLQCSSDEPNRVELNRCSHTICIANLFEVLQRRTKSRIKKGEATDANEINLHLSLQPRQGPSGQALFLVLLTIQYPVARPDHHNLSGILSSTPVPVVEIQVAQPSNGAPTTTLGKVALSASDLNE